MTITCVIPTCDRPEFLAESLASVFAQSRPADEILVVNNGKAPAQVPREFAGRIKVCDIVPYAGVAQARNFGASAAASQFIAFLDDDDKWNMDYLKNVADAFDAGADCVVSRLDQLQDGKISTYKDPSGKLDSEHLLVYNPGVTGTNTAVSKKAFWEVGGYDPKLPPSEDKALVLEAILRGMKVAVLPQNQAVIRQHGATRLTNSAKIAEGVYQFLRKYRSRMTTAQKLKNWLKVHRHRYDAGKKLSIFPFAVLYLITRVLK